MKIEVINDTMMKVIPECKAEEIYLENLPDKHYEISKDRTGGYKIEPNIFYEKD